MRVAVTGSSGHLGRVLIPALLARPDITGVVALDRAPPPAEFPDDPRLTPVEADITAPGLADHLAEVDAVIHLAFVVHRGGPGAPRRRAELRRINVDGSAGLFRTAVEAGAGTLVHLSSAAVYGAWPDNPERLTEDAPSRPNPGFAYAEDKAAVEAELDRLADRAPGLRVVRLRPPAILGPHALPLLRRLLTSPVRPWYRRGRPQPRFQCVWEGDVVDALLRAVTRPVHGAFNLAAEPPLTAREMKAAAGRRALPLPIPLLAAAHHALWPFTAAWGEPGWGAGLTRPLVLDCSRARAELGWTASRDSARCIRATVTPSRP
ncbi:MAG: NAD-dependent epimerase/dehydratase family protein [Pseudomonadota bacterium]